MSGAAVSMTRSLSKKFSRKKADVAYTTPDEAENAIVPTLSAEETPENTLTVKAADEEEASSSKPETGAEESATEERKEVAAKAKESRTSAKSTPKALSTDDATEVARLPKASPSNSKGATATGGKRSENEAVARKRKLSRQLEAVPSMSGVVVANANGNLATDDAFSRTLSELKKGARINFTLPDSDAGSSTAYSGRVVATKSGASGNEFTITFTTSVASSKVPESSQCRSTLKAKGKKESSNDAKEPSRSRSKASPRSSKRSSMATMKTKDGRTIRYKDIGFHHSQCSGMLWKKNQEGIHGLRRWKQRYCVITEDAFQYFAKPADLEPRGQIELKYVTGIDRIAVPEKNRFTIYADTIKLYEFRANSEKECDKWIRWLMNVFSEDRPLDRREW